MGKLDNARFLIGDAGERLRDLEPESVQTAITSPPYWGLRDYEHDGQIGLEENVNDFIDELCDILDEVGRVLRPDGTLWLNMGDSYFGSGRAQGKQPKADEGRIQATNTGSYVDPPDWSNASDVLKPKDQSLIPHRVAIELQRRGWYVRSTVVWHKCLSGGTRVYARTQKDVHTTTIRELSRLDCSTIELWNGEKWTQVNAISETPRPDNTISLTLRSGERIGCTSDHRWPLEDGRVVEASDLEEGDIIERCELPEPETPNNPGLLPNGDIGWIVGYYLAEGHIDKEGVKFTCHSDEKEYVKKVKQIASNLGASTNVFRFDEKNYIRIEVYGSVFQEVIEKYIHGSSSKTKKLKQSCWKRSDEFLTSLFNGYLGGDGWFDQENNRWRLRFTRNRRLSQDFRTLCARLGYDLSLRKSTTTGFGEEWKTYEGDVRKISTDHRNSKSKGEIVKIGSSRARKFYDIAVEDGPHTFSLASGVLTHNSTAMPESVKDRPTNAHEYFFLLSKNEQYFYDHFAIKEPMVTGGEGSLKNKRDVWSLSGGSFSGDHFATFPKDLVEPPIKASTSEKGQCAECGTPIKRIVEKGDVAYEDAGDRKRSDAPGSEISKGHNSVFQEGVIFDEQTAGWERQCDCDNEETEPQIVLDPFQGSGTTGIVALKHGRRFIGIDLNEKFIEIAKDRIQNDEDVPVNHTFW